MCKYSKMIFDNDKQVGAQEHYPNLLPNSLDCQYYYKVFNILMVVFGTSIF